MAQSMLKALFSTLPVFAAGLAQAQTTPATQSGPDAQPPSPPMGSDPSLPPSPGAPSKPTDRQSRRPPYPSRRENSRLRPQRPLGLLALL